MKRVWIMTVLAVLGLTLSNCADKPLTEEDMKAMLEEKNKATFDEIGTSSPRSASPLATEPGEPTDTAATGSSAGSVGAGQSSEPFSGTGVPLTSPPSAKEPTREPLPEPPAGVKLDPRDNQYQHYAPGIPDGAATPLTDPNTPVSSPASGD